MAISEDQVREWWRAFVDAWARQDVESTVALFSSEATYSERWYAAAVAGESGLREYWRRVAEATADVSPGFELLAVVEDRAITRWWVGYREVASGEEVRLEGVALVEHGSDGRATTWREWFDAAPAHGSRPTRSSATALPG